MLRTFSLDIDDLVCVMTQAVNKATEPWAPKQAHEAEDSKGSWAPQEVSNTHHSNLKKSGLKRQQQSDSGLVFRCERPWFECPFWIQSYRTELPSFLASRMEFSVLNMLWRMYESVPQKAIILMTLYFHAFREPSFQIYVQNVLLKAEPSRSSREDAKLYCSI